MENQNTTLKDRYQLTRLLGRGGMGEVYLAEDTLLSRQVAVKKVLYSGNEYLLRTAQTEAMVLARLRHESLPKILDYFNADQTQYIVMEYIEGQDLGEMLQLNHGPFPLAKVWPWAETLLDVLEYLHRQEPPVVHRDIKPQNIKITSEGKLFLLDFGLVKDTPTRVAGGSLSPSVYGYSQNYAPLEQINGDPTSVQTDVYGLCATLYHLLTNVKPPDALDRATKKIERKPDSLRPAHEVNSNVPPGLSQVLEHGLQLNNYERIKSVQGLRHLLQQERNRSTRIEVNISHEADGYVSQLVPPPPPAPRPRRFLGWGIAATAVVASVSFVVLALAAVFGYQWWQRSLVEQAAREMFGDAQALERAEGLLSQGACSKYRSIESGSVEAVMAKELVRKLNDCTAVQSRFQEAENAEKRDGLYGSATAAYRKVVESYPGSSYARLAEKKIGQFEKARQATLKAWREMQEADNQNWPDSSASSDVDYDAWTKLANRYDLIGSEDVDAELANHIRSCSSAFKERRAVLEKVIKDVADLASRVRAKQDRCNSCWFCPSECSEEWRQSELRKIYESYKTANAPVQMKLNALAEADKTIGSRLSDRYKAEFKDLF
jgi:Protein kinase domain